MHSADSKCVPRSNSCDHVNVANLIRRLALAVTG
jgi:hypothetical protein